MSQLTAELVDRLDVEQALSDELDHIPDLLPKQPADQALVEEREGMVTTFANSCWPAFQSNPPRRSLR